MKRGHALVVDGLLVAAASWWLYTQGRLQDITGILIMSLMTCWFILWDMAIDEQFEIDAERAKYERQLWERDMY